MSVKLDFVKKSGIMLALSDSLIMSQRSCTHLFRSMNQMLGAILQPIMFLGLFVAVFSGAMAGSLPNGISYLDYLMAGVIVYGIAVSATTIALGVSTDLQKGIVDRFRSLPMNSLAVLNGHVIANLLRNGISVVALLLVGIIFGFRPHADLSGWLAIVGILVLFTLALSWVAALLGVLAKSVESVPWLTTMVVIPFAFISSGFVPPQGMTPILSAFAENQPVSQVMEAVRALILGTPIGDYGWKAVVWSIGILVVSMPLAAWSFRRQTSK